MQRFAIGSLLAFLLSIVAAIGVTPAASSAGVAMPTVSSAEAALAPQAALSGPSKFIAVAPTRVLDTRVGIGSSGAVPAGGTVTLVMPGRGGVAASGVTAVLLNVTVAEAAGPGFVQVFPTGQATIGASSNLNVEYVGQTIPNLVVAPLGDAGQVSFFTVGGGHLIADVFGYFTAASSSVDGRYVPVFPNRLLDTRMQSPGKLGAGGSVRVQIAGRSGVPATGASAVVLNVTATDATGAGYVQVLPTGQAAFGSFSNLNVMPGQTIPNLVVVPVGADGSVTVFSERGTDVLVDVFGYFTNQIADLSGDGLFVPLSPTRLLDTRGGAKPAAGSITSISPAGQAGMPSSGVAAVFGNVTATEASGAGYVQVAPGPATAAPVGFWSNANTERAGQTIPNAAIANIGSDGTVLLYTSNAAHLLVDASGYFTGTAAIVNHPPTLLPIQVSVTGGQSIDINVLGYASEPDDDPMAITGFSQPGDGVVSQIAAGAIRYNSYVGADRDVSFSVTVSDSRGASTTTTVTVHISSGVVPPPCSTDFGGNGAYPAEYAQIAGTGSAGPRCVNSGFRGTGYIGDWNGSQTITFIVNVAASSQYNITFRYQNATGTSSRQLTVPNGITTMAFPNTHGGDTSGNWVNGAWSEVPVNVSLNAGPNIISLSGGNGFVDLDEISSVTQTPTGPPSAPTLLTGTALSWTGNDPQTAVGQFQLQWNDNANNETGYRIYGNTSYSSTRTLLATTGPNVTSAIISAMGYATRGGGPVILVLAFNSAGESSPVSFVPSAPVPNPPLITSYARLDANTVQVQWTHEPVIGFETARFALRSPAQAYASCGYACYLVWPLNFTSTPYGNGKLYTATVNIPSGADQTLYQCVTVLAANPSGFAYTASGSTDSPIACLSSLPPGQDPYQRTFQAEDAALSGSPAPVRSTDNPGYTGTGYVGAFGSVGQRITFNVHNVGAYTSYALYMRERSVETGVTRRIYVNGVDYGLVALPQTSSTWTANAWALAGPVSINLHQGDNTIVLEYVGSGGYNYADVDSIQVNRA